MRVTIKMIAEKAGVDPGAVSRTLCDDPQAQRLRPETRERIRKIARALGYRPNLLARSLKTGKSHIIGLVGFSLQNEVNAPAVVHLTEELLKYGYTTQMVYDRADPKLRLNACYSLIDQGCDALIISGYLDENQNKQLSQFPVPVFLLTPLVDSPLKEHTIQYNYTVGCRAALIELTKLGHRNIYYVGLSWDFWQTDPRYQVFQSFMQEHLSLFTPEKQVCYFQNLFEMNEENFRTWLLSHLDVTAFVVPGDLIAMKLIQLMAKLNLYAPQDISVIGFDDIETSQYYNPALSTVRKDVKVSARELVKLAMNVLESKNVPIQHLIPCNFINRQSISPVRVGALKIQRKENQNEANP